MSKLQIAAFAALAILAAVMAFPFVLPADANGDAASVKAQMNGAATSGYRTCFMERRLVVSGDAPRMEQARRCITAP